MRGAKIAAIVLAIADVAVWGIPALIYSALWTSHYAQGPGSLFLFAIAPGPYCVGLILSVVTSINLYRSGRLVAAIAVAGIFLVLGLLVGLWGILVLGST